MEAKSFCDMQCSELKPHCDRLKNNLRLNECPCEGYSAIQRPSCRKELDCNFQPLTGSTDRVNCVLSSLCQKCNIILHTGVSVPR